MLRQKYISWPCIITNRLTKNTAPATMYIGNLSVFEEILVIGFSFLASYLVTFVTNAIFQWVLKRFHQLSRKARLVAKLYVPVSWCLQILVIVLTLSNVLPVFTLSVESQLMIKAFWYLLATSLFWIGVRLYQFASAELWPQQSHMQHVLSQHSVSSVYSGSAVHNHKLQHNGERTNQHEQMQVRELISSVHLDKEITSFLQDLTQIVLGLAIVYVYITSLNLNFAPLLTSAGIITAVVGYSSTQWIQNLMAAFQIYWDQLFQMGDLVRVAIPYVGTFEGVVRMITLRVTALELQAGEIQIIQNSQMTNALTHLGYHHICCQKRFTFNAKQLTYKQILDFTDQVQHRLVDRTHDLVDHQNSYVRILTDDMDTAVVEVRVFHQLTGPVMSVTTSAASQHSEFENFTHALLGQIHAIFDSIRVAK